MRAVVIAVLQVAGQIAAQGRDAADQGAGEAGSRALLHYGRVDALDAPIALGPAWAQVRGGRTVHPDAVAEIDVDGRRRGIYLEADRGRPNCGAMG